MLWVLIRSASACFRGKIRKISAFSINEKSALSVGMVTTYKDSIFNSVSEYKEIITISNIVLKSTEKDRLSTGQTRYRTKN